MKNCLVIGTILVGELYGMGICGWLYSEKPNAISLSLLIVCGILTFISSVISSIILVKDKRDKDKEIEQKRKKCPYFIEKYDDMENPEYIDRSIK